MRINEFRESVDDLFEDADVDSVLEVAVQGETSWSKPMTAEEAIALTLGIKETVENARQSSSK